MDEKKMRNCANLPQLFMGARDYKDDPLALEMAQATFNEEGLYQAITAFAAMWYERGKRPARVVDLCAATGLCTMRVSRDVPVESATLVDTDRRALECAGQRLLNMPIELRVDDAAEFRSRSRYDLVLANSAYHHISDDRKIDFLKTASTLVEDNGAILIGEHFLPPYSSVQEFRRSVELFYSQLVQELEGCGESAAAIDVIRRSAFYTWIGEYEFKVSWAVFLEHCASADLRVERICKIWEPNGIGNSGVGTFALWMRPCKQPAFEVANAG